MEIVHKLVLGAHQRKSRLHDENGNLVSLSKLVKNAPRALFSSLARIAIEYKQARPWISYDAQQVIASFLGPSSRVLEFGSGMSTAWYAKRAGFVLSVDDNPEWFERIQKVVPDNVDYRFATGQDYIAPTEESFDLIMVDGSQREMCCEVAISLVAPNGMIYLDNSDKGTAGDVGNVPRANEILLDFAKSQGCEVTYFTDFVPTLMHVTEGMMVTTKA